MSDTKFPTFFFDGNRWFGIIDSPARWFDLLASYNSDEDLQRVLDAKMAPQLEMHELPAEYFMGAGGVYQGDIPSFGFRREHLPGTIRLEDWTKNRGLDLRELTTKRVRA